MSFEANVIDIEKRVFHIVVAAIECGWGTESEKSEENENESEQENQHKHRKILIKNT